MIVIIKNIKDITPLSGENDAIPRSGKRLTQCLLA